MKTIDFYDKGKWESRVSKLLMRERVSLKLLGPFLRKKISFLDVGCGSGEFLENLLNSYHKKNLDLYGVDYSKFQIKKASKLPCKFRVCNLEKGLPFNNEKFDIVYAGEIIEHLYNPDLLVSEAYRVLKDQGYLLFTTPNLCAWFNRLLFLFGIQPIYVETSTESGLVGSGLLRSSKKGEIPVGHLRIFNKTAVEDILEASGFCVIKIKGSIFDSGFPNWLLKIDSMFTLIPSLSAGLVVLAQKK